jgi:hypothetical protein
MERLRIVNCSLLIAPQRRKSDMPRINEQLTMRNLTWVDANAGGLSDGAPTRAPRRD